MISGVGGCCLYFLYLFVYLYICIFVFVFVFVLVFVFVFYVFVFCIFVTGLTRNTPFLSFSTYSTFFFTCPTVFHREKLPVSNFKELLTIGRSYIIGSLNCRQAINTC